MRSRSRPAIGRSKNRKNHIHAYYESSAEDAILQSPAPWSRALLSFVSHYSHRTEQS
jgi:hypothetical protein